MADRDKRRRRKRRNSLWCLNTSKTFPSKIRTRRSRSLRVRSIRKSEFRSMSEQTRFPIATSKFQSNSKAKQNQQAPYYFVLIWTLPAFFAFETFHRKA